MKETKTINVKLRFRLNQEEAKFIKSLLHKGKESVRVFRRALVLNLFHQGHTSPTISKYIGVTPETVRRIGWNYIEGGLGRALYDLPRPGNERLLTEKQSNQIIALACTDPPEGYSRWTIELLTEKAIEKGIVSTVGRETIRVLLHTHDIKPWREKNVVYSGDDS
jgi:transposase